MRLSSIASARRLPPWFVKDPLIKALIPGSGSLEQAKNELRWLKQELKDPAALRRAVKLRGKQSYPLQYILKSQPFGPLEIICEPGALIPRWETEEWAMSLASELKSSQPAPKILDICSGTGCILFLLCRLLKTKGWALDLSPDAIEVFRKNQQALGMEACTDVMLGDLYRPLPPSVRNCDLVVANPPYIINKHEVEPSVARFEPEMALYETPDIWEALVARTLETTATRAVFELGSATQIDECVGLFQSAGWSAEGRKDGAMNWRTVWASS